MKTKGKIAWLITWEGPEAEYNGRCKIVAVLPPQLREAKITSLLPVLFCSEYGFTQCEKMGFAAGSRNDPYFKEAYKDINPEFWYGHIGKGYLCARKVKNLRCEENRQDCFDSALFWTELPQFIPNPEIDPNAPLPANLPALTKEVRGESEVSYTHSIRRSIEDSKQRREAHQKNSRHRH